MSDTINYGNLMHRAMRSLIQEVLEGVQENGLPGEHHFFITFDTKHPDAKLADWLKERYPDEMTVVMQHWFDDLEVTDIGFSITLNFGDQPVSLYVPYDAIKTFVDPSVEFGLRFETQDDDDADDTPDEDNTDNTDDDQDTSADDGENHKDADVVSLDSFRK
ncbi:MAG: ClpXP protease specificity-enhancing factor SspB [Rhodobacterales bacterium]|nr:ClpXP protease specificity-enhancing factor SspB [Rhodobacterales bacterium]